MYKVKTDLGSTWRRHVDQIKPSKIAEDMTQNTPLIDEPSVETTENTPLIEEPSVETTENTPLIEEPSVETTENTPLIEEPSVETTENTPLIEEPSVEATENTMTDVQTDNINDKPIDRPSTITAVQERRYPERIRKQTKRLITEI